VLGGGRHAPQPKGWCRSSTRPGPPSASSSA
jgi:hypothetical protein